MWKLENRIFGFPIFLYFERFFMEFVILGSPDSSWIGKSFLIRDGDIIGSGAASVIVLNSPEILPQHLRLSVNGNSVIITAMSSHAQFFVNQQLVTKATLVNGDLIDIDGYSLIVKDTEEEQKKIQPNPSVLESRIESRQKYYDSTKHILESLGNQEKSQRRLITLYKISNAISGILDLDQLLKNLLQIILSEFGGNRGFIMLCDDQMELFPAASLSDKGETIVPKISERIVQEIFATKESILCENILDDERFRAQDSLIRQNILSTLCVPLIRNREILGLILIDSQQRGKFSKSDLDLLTQVATQAAIVIENARFYKSRQDFNRNLLLLYQATQVVSSYLRSDLIIQDVTRYACQIFSAKISALFLVEKQNIKLAYATGIPAEIWPQLNFPSSLRKVLDEQIPVLFNKHTLPDLATIFPINTSVMAVPVVVSPQQRLNSMGLLCVGDRINIHIFTQEDKQLLSILASYTAIALSNAIFYEELKTKEKEIAEWSQQLEQRVAERTQELRTMQNKLSISDKMAAIGLLAAGVAHEFNNIIASMYGFAQIAAKNDEYKDRLIKIVLEQSKRACQITESLQSFSKQRGDTRELADVQEILESILYLSESSLVSEGIKIIKQYHPIPKLILNVSRMQQVFINIIVNARHAIEKDGCITIRIDPNVDKKTVKLEFEDNGKGIPPDKIDKIFEPFYTTKGSFGGGTQPGTGMGLALCYNIIKAHGGDISVRSTLGKGTCFTIVLPIPESAPVVVSATIQKSDKRGTGQRVLIIEDTDSISNLLSQILKEKGFNVYTVGDSCLALDLCKKDIFNYIFFNTCTAGCRENPEIFDEIKRLEPEAKIILLTGRIEDSSVMRYVGAVDGYLRKPFDLDDVYRLLQ